MSINSKIKLNIKIMDGLTDYNDAHQLQLETVARRKRKEIPDTLILLEHPPVITLGRNAAAEGVVASPSRLLKLGVQTHRIERGGQATYHGPGQIVGYPIVNLHKLKMGIAQYVSRLESTMIEAAATMQIRAQRREGITGVFAESYPGPKIGAIGVRVTSGITFHGFALNIDPDLTHYQLIVPCGMSTTPVSSIIALGGKIPHGTSARDIVANAFVKIFDYKTI